MNAIRTADVPDCRLCGGAGAPLHADVEDRLFGIPGRWSLLRCAACALVWLSPRPEAADISRLYQGYYTHEEEAPPSALQRAVRHGIPAAVLGYAQASPGFGARLLSRVGPLREAGVRSALGLDGHLRGRLLDVGCGSGLLLGTLRDLGWDVSGSEIDPDAAAVARARVGCEVHEGAVEELSLPAGHYQAVTLSHVIEHVLDPVATLRECGRLLARDGRVAIVTPNAASRGSRAFGPDWRGWEPPRHIHVFEPESLVQVVERAGLRVVSCETPASSAYYLWLESARLRGDAPSTAARLRALAFWIDEYRRVRAGDACGEEILLLAKRA
ncbi:MAG: class I SAM-dependent methyltransferase [Deltaproteobacteria bacterium]|nr:class I SAM-dependent methyltransferase [Deltaproteobacteria bacterium]